MLAPPSRKEHLNLVSTEPGAAQTVYELIISKEAKPETPDEGKKVDGGLDATQPPDSGAA
jgi:hypothetical protein